MAADHYYDTWRQAVFLGGVHFPPRARYGRMGLDGLLAAAAKQWKEKREKLLDSADQIEAFLKEQEQLTVSSEPGPEIVKAGIPPVCRQLR